MNKWKKCSPKFSDFCERAETPPEDANGAFCCVNKVSQIFEYTFYPASLFLLENCYFPVRHKLFTKDNFLLKDENLFTTLLRLGKNKCQVLNWILIVCQKRVELSYHKVDYKPFKCRLSAIFTPRSCLNSIIIYLALWCRKCVISFHVKSVTKYRFKYRERIKPLFIYSGEKSSRLLLLPRLIQTNWKHRMKSFTRERAWIIMK